MAHYAKAPTIDLTYGVSLRSVLKWKRHRRAKAIENYIEKNYPNLQPVGTSVPTDAPTRLQKILNSIKSIFK
jgi:hypothetical protein